MTDQWRIGFPRGKTQSRNPLPTTTHVIPKVRILLLVVKQVGIRRWRKANYVVSMS